MTASFKLTVSSALVFAFAGVAFARALSPLDPVLVATATDEEPTRRARGR
jgi:hypothetical protein